MAHLVGGKAYFTVDGISYSTKGEFEIEISNVSREADTFSDGRVFYTESTTPSRISGTVYVTKDVDVMRLLNAIGATVVVELNSGKVCVLRDAVQVGQGSFNTQTGALEIEFKGVGEWLK